MWPDRPNAKGGRLKFHREHFEGSPRIAGLSIGVALLGLIVFVFGEVIRYDFVNLDDPIYVRDNPYVQMGLTWASVSWAFTTGTAGNWHPLTWLSHMLDIQLFGAHAGAHHATSVVIHACNTLALFALLWRITGAMGRSAFVAALFGVHPLHVESVAWISERKDVLSTLFWMATVGSYVAFVRSHRPRHLAATTVFFTLGLLAKPMLVSLPLLLLLFDVWPLRRLTLLPPDIAAARGVVWEKAPLVAMAAAASFVALYTQRSVGTTASLVQLTLGDRATHALIAYFTYVQQMLWPTNLSAFYPYPSQAPPIWQWVAIGASMAAISVWAVMASRRTPYIFTGWFWFVIMMLPVIGLVQIGNQSTADRYTYLPLVGLFVLFGWGVPEMLSRWPRARGTLTAVGVALVLGCAVSARQQAQVWADSETLWRHALAGNPHNYYAHGALGGALSQKGDLVSAVHHLAEAVRLKPGPPRGRTRLGRSACSPGQAVGGDRAFQRGGTPRSWVRGSPSQPRRSARPAGSVEAGDRGAENRDPSEPGAGGEPSFPRDRTCAGWFTRRCVQRLSGGAPPDAGLARYPLRLRGFARTSG